MIAIAENHRVNSETVQPLDGALSLMSSRVTRAGRYRVRVVIMRRRA